MNKRNQKIHKIMKTKENKYYSRVQTWSDCHFLRWAKEQGIGVEDVVISTYEQADEGLTLTWNYSKNGVPYLAKVLDDTYAEPTTINYVRLGRSPNAAKAGNCYYINEHFAEAARRYLDLGLPKIDIDPSYESYRALVLSTVLDRSVDLTTDNILVIDDHIKMIPCDVAAVKVKNGKSYIEYSPSDEVESNLWDGQSLIEKSLLGGEDFACLRNHWFKTMALGFRLQDFFEDNGITELTDIWGRKHNARDIKLICTPTVMKWMKLKEMTYDKWASHVNKYNTPFLVNKEEHDTIYRYHAIKDANGDYIGDPAWQGRPCVKMSYQMVQTLRNGNFEELTATTRAIDFALKGDDEYFKEYLETKSSYQNLDHWAWMAGYKLLINTKEFKEMRKFQTFKIRKEAKENGKLFVMGANLIVACNPIMMAQAACGLPMECEFSPVDNMIGGFTGRSVFGEEIAIFRSPHQVPNNIGAVQKQECDALYRYVGSVNNVIILDAYNTNVQARMSGMDEDGDFVLATSEQVITEWAKECMRRFPCIKNEVGTTKRKWASLYEMDKAIARTKITTGISANLSLDIMGWWHELGQPKELLMDACLASTYCQISVDAAKKVPEINMISDLAELKTKYNYDNGEKQLTWPSDNKKKKHRNCTLDNLYISKEKYFKRGIKGDKRLETSLRDHFVDLGVVDERVDALFDDVVALANCFLANDLEDKDGQDRVNEFERLKAVTEADIRHRLGGLGDISMSEKVNILIRHWLNKNYTSQLFGRIGAIIFRLNKKAFIASWDIEEE